MIRSTLGAPLGGTMRAGHHGVESVALGLMTPANFGGGAGSCLPSIVVVALGCPNIPVTCCAAAGPIASMAANKDNVDFPRMDRPFGLHIMPVPPCDLEKGSNWPGTTRKAILYSSTPRIETNWPPHESKVYSLSDNRVPLERSARDSEKILAAKP